MKITFFEREGELKRNRVSRSWTQLWNSKKFIKQKQAEKINKYDLSFFLSY